MINIEQWNEFVARWQEKECYGAEKYLHWKSQIDKFSELATSANLLDGGLDILDISTGMGIWPYTLQSLGHSVKMTDTIDKKTEIYRDAHAVLGLPLLYEHRYPKSRFKPLPENIGCFDVISAIACAPMSIWNAGELDLFFRDCFVHLKNNGFILLSPNIAENIKIIEAHPGIETFKTNQLKYYKIRKQELK